jgi:hypothetical protein
MEGGGAAEQIDARVGDELSAIGAVDQFGSRVLTKLKQQQLCVPAQRTP